MREQPFDSDSINDNFGFVYKITNTQRYDRTLEESIFGLLENHQERNENKNKNLIGRSIMDLVLN